jgi:cobyrinic acid a,c-diamide synthase
VQIAKWLGAPVVLVVDCWAMARSAAAVIKGYAEFDPGVQLVPWVFSGFQTAQYV